MTGISVPNGRGRLTPLITSGGGSGSSARPAGAPTLLTARLTNSTFWFEDFHNPTVGPASFGSGLVATPDTITQISPFGGPNWIVTETAGTTGTAGTLSDNTNGYGLGILQLTPGATSGNTMLVESNYKVGATNPGTGWNTATTGPSIAYCRHSGGGTVTTSTRGIGWCTVASAAVGVDWLTDPDTTFATGNALILHRNTAAYNGATAGSVILRYYGAAGVDNLTFDITALTGIGTSGTQYFSLECYWNGSNSILCYFGSQNSTSLGLARTLVATIPVTTPASTTLRPIAGIQTNGAVTRNINIDCFYHEHSIPLAR